MSVSRVGPVLLALNLLLLGCALPGPEPERRTMTDPAKLGAQQALAGVQWSEAGWPRDEWWRAFADPQLDRVLERALAGNPSFAIAHARYARARAAVIFAESALRPETIGALDMSRRRFSETGVLEGAQGGSWSSQNRLAVDFSWDLDLWGRNQAALQSALGQAKAAEVDIFATRLVLTTGIARLYVELSRLYEQADVARAALKHRETVLALTAKRYQAGIDSRVELTQAEAEVPAVRADLAAIEESIMLTKNLLAALMGEGPDAGLTIVRPKLTPANEQVLPLSLPADLLGRRPDLVANRWRVEAAARDIEVARAQFYPNVNLIAFAGFSSIGLSNFISSGTAVAGIGPAVRVPLFDGGRLRAELAGRRAEYDIAVEQYNQSLLDAIREVVDQVTSIRALTVRRADQAVALARYRQAYELALVRYREGMGNYLAVLSTEIQLLQQSRIDADLRARGLDLAIGLVRALGGGFQ